MTIPSGDDDDSRIPPRPPLPSRTGENLPPRSGENLHAQWQAKKAEIETHVSHARDQIDQANERIKERTGRDLVLATLVGLLIGAVIVASLLLVKW